MVDQTERYARLIAAMESQRDASWERLLTSYAVLVHAESVLQRSRWFLDSEHEQFPMTLRRDSDRTADTTEP